MENLFVSLEYSRSNHTFTTTPRLERRRRRPPGGGPGLSNEHLRTQSAVTASRIDLQDRGLPHVASNSSRWVRRSDALKPLWLASAAAMLDYPEQTTKMFVAGGVSSVPFSFAGQALWAFFTGAAVVSSPSLSNNGSAVYVGSDDTNLYAVDAASGQKKWAFATGSYVEPSPTLSNDESTVYVGSYDKNLYAVDAATGQKKWAFARELC